MFEFIGNEIIWKFNRFSIKIYISMETSASRSCCNRGEVPLDYAFPKATFGAKATSRIFRLLRMLEIPLPRSRALKNLTIKILDCLSEASFQNFVRFEEHREAEGQVAGRPFFWFVFFGPQRK